MTAAAIGAQAEEAGEGYAVSSLMTTVYERNPGEAVRFGYDGRSLLLPMACVSAVAAVTSVMGVLWVTAVTAYDRCGWSRACFGGRPVGARRAGAGTFPKTTRARDVVAGRDNEPCAPLTMSVSMRCLRKFTKAAAVSPSSY